jgi:sugar lactone lactonase YvrE
MLLTTCSIMLLLGLHSVAAPLQIDANWHADPIGTTHGGVVALPDGRILVNTDTKQGTLVLAADGSAQGFIAGAWPAIHAMVVRTEGDDQRLYAAHLGGQQVLKLRPDGTLVWALGIPMESGKYTSLGQYKPTGIAVGPDGRIYVADGYGQQWVHIFGPDLTYQSSFGGRGSDEGRFQTCHGLLLDERTTPPTLLVCDRENRRIQRFDLDGTFMEVHAKALRRPCAMSISPIDGTLAVAELEGRVTLLDRSGKVIGHLGDNPDQSQRASHGVHHDDWVDGVHTAPHGLCWDAKGNLYVQDWNAHGRISRWMPTVDTLSTERNN